MAKVVISTRKLTKIFKSVQKQNLLKDLFFPSYKYVTSVKDLDLQIMQNEAVAFLGPNGAGKTTTIKMLTGLMYPTSGKVSVLGYEPFKREYDFLRQIGLILGNKGAFNWDLTPIQNFDLIRQIYDIPYKITQKRLDKYVSMFGVKHVLHTQVRNLSLGERMKLNLISTLLYAPKVLFLDEPTIGMDVVSKTNIRQLLRDLVETEEITLMLTSHDMDDVEQICKRVIILNEGKKIYDGTLDDLKRKYATTKYLEFVFANKINLKSSIIQQITRKAVSFNLKQSVVLRLELKKADVVPVLNMVMRNLPVVDIDIKSKPLTEIIEDIFAKRYKK